MEKIEKVVKVLLYVFICFPMAIGLIIAAIDGNDGNSNAKQLSSAPYMRNFNNQKRQYELKNKECIITPNINSLNRH